MGSSFLGARLIAKMAALSSHVRQRRIYAPLLKEHGVNSHLSTHWNSQKSQWTRFEILVEELGGLGALQGRTVLDVGCGCGDFAAYLDEAGGVPSELVGVDIVPAMVSACEQRFAGVSSQAQFQRRFECRDILLRPLMSCNGTTGATFDFVVSSGVFAFGNDTFFREMTAASCAMARQAYSFNLFGECSHSCTREPSSSH
jgi:SAM-dependent methyltransferase